jgi:GC-rich sequence DNA-binding factor
MRDMIGRAEEKRAWFSSFKQWVEGVAAFLDEKVCIVSHDYRLSSDIPQYPLLEKLEEEHASLLKERFDMIDKRRKADDTDDLATFLGPLPVVKPAEPEVVGTDELGRVVNPGTLKRERREARIRRHQAHQHKSEEEQQEEEGFSTDSSLSLPDVSDYAKALKSLAVRKKDVLSDVRAEEFRDPGKGRWSIWREKYADSYVGAWGGLGVVGVWEFWVRLEMVGWDCVEVGLVNNPVQQPS